MSKSSDIFSLPAAPPELCFDKNDFMKKTFSVDNFLHEHRNVGSLETMRDDLGIYLKVLRSAMIELINEDYADFVNLSTNLLGLDQQINTTQSPLQQLNDEVIAVRKVIEDTMKEIEQGLEQKRKLREYKKSLQSLAKVYKSIIKLTDLLEHQLSANEIKPVILERAALELVQLQFHVKSCSDYLDEARKEKTEKLHKELLAKLRQHFLNVLKSDIDSIERCLRIYATIDEYQAAERVFREDIVEPYMNTRITENILQNSNQGLVSIYNQVLDFISLHMKDLLLLTHHTDRVKGFNFLVNSFWVDVEHRLECNISSIFAPGNPESFYVKYKTSLDFIANIEKILGNENAICDFRSHEQYSSFQSRWSLPVYFQIRFQEIAGRFETTCKLDLSETLINKDSSEFKCIVFKTALKSINKLWSDGIYIEEIFPKFWRLTLQILARTAMWLNSAITDAETYSKSDQKLDKHVFFVSLHRDAHTLMEQFPNILKVALEKAPVAVHENVHLLERCLSESRQQLLEPLNTIEEFLVKEIVTTSSSNIRQTNDIPRLYRKTNRDVPTKPCAYVGLMAEPFQTFKVDYKGDLGEEKIRDLFTNAFSKVSVQYCKAIEEVLTSVQKTEESLRRLKNLREKSSASTSSSQQTVDRLGMSDDDKIRLQLQIDVRHWTNEIESNSIKREDVESLPDMISLVEDTTKSNKNSDK